MPRTVLYGTSISAALLSVTADVPGSFEYLIDGKPALGGTLPVGEHLVLARFTPSSTSVSGASISFGINVKPAPVTIRLAATSKLQGDADPAFTYTVIGLVGGDQPAVLGALTPSRVAGEDVGSYAISMQVRSANYDVTVVPATLTISSTPIMPTRTFNMRVLFAAGSSTLSRDAQQALRAVVSKLEGSVKTVTVVGFVATGKLSQQRTLSARRAAVVGDFLRGLALAGDFTVRGGGSTAAIGPIAQRVGVWITTQG